MAASKSTKRIVGQYLRTFGVDQGLDVAFHRLGRCAVAIRRLHARREEIFEVEQPAVAVKIFVAGHAADGRFVHFDCFGHLPQRQRAQLRDAAAKKAVLLFHDLGRDLHDRALPLVHRLDQPVGVGDAVVEPALVALSAPSSA